ncbi:MAG: phosphotransferase [Clostridiales bacterium]|nr:phosphotransferase [Clostridiales bacterium]
MDKNFSADKLYEICRLDDWQAFESYLQNELQIENYAFVLQDDILRAVLSTENIFNGLTTVYQIERNNNGFFVHPLLHIILNFALAYSITYEQRIFKILNFGIAHNLKISKQLCCDQILQNGDLILNNKIIGRAVVFNTAEPLNGTDRLFLKLDELNNSVKAIRAKQLYLAGGYSGFSVKLADGVIEKDRTFNECEYLFLKLLEQNGYSKAPRYLGERNGKDLFSYIKGETISYTYEMSQAAIIKITNELKALNTISKKYLNDKVYAHGDLGAQNVIFNNTEIVGIIDWDNTFIGDEYDDFIYVFWVWANVGNLQRSDDRMFELLNTMIETYQPDDRFRNDFSNKIWQRMERKLTETPVNSKTYKRIYDWVKWSQKWVEKYSTRISNEIG